VALSEGQCAAGGSFCRAAVFDDALKQGALRAGSSRFQDIFGGMQMLSLLRRVSGKQSKFAVRDVAMPLMPLRILMMAVLATSAMIGVASEPDTGESVGTDQKLESRRLRIEARLAAEQGNFERAASQLQAAARVTGDLRTAERARAAMETAGGSNLADFSELITLIREQTAPAVWEDEELGTPRFSTFAQGVLIGGPAVMGAVVASLDESQLFLAAELARTGNRNQNVRQQSSLRFVSLNRLEKFLSQQTAASREISEEAEVLAGINELQYLVRIPETGEILIGGPAEDWKKDTDGRFVGVESGRPVLKLDDLVTLWRTFSRDGAGYFMCSIDPKQGQVKALNDYLKSHRGQLTASNAAQWTQELQSTLGMQNVILQGVPTDSRVASVIVDADYRMKEIGIGRREGVSGMKSYFDLLSRSERKGSGKAEALRWWMTVAYGAIEVAPDRNTWHFADRSVQCLSENQLVGADGDRKSTGKADRANGEFASLFTKHLPKLAESDAVFADLENVFDLALAAALAHNTGISARSGLNSTSFAVGGEYVAASVEVPQELMTAAESRVYPGGDVVIQVAGGVRGDLRSIVKNAASYIQSPELAAVKTSAHPAGHSENRWWWDARQSSAD
jgi:hypothetical protein